MNREQINKAVDVLVQAAIKTDDDIDWALAWGAYQTPVGEKPDGSYGKTDGPWRIPYFAWRRAMEMRFGSDEAAKRSLVRLTPTQSPVACGAAPAEGTSPVKKKDKRRKCSACGEPGHTKRKCPGVEEEAPESPAKRKGRGRAPAEGEKDAPARSRGASGGSKKKPKPPKRTSKKRKRKPPSDDEHIDRIDALLSASMKAYEEALPEDHLPDDEVLAIGVVEWAIATAIKTELGEDRGDLLKLVVRSLNDLVDDAYEEGDGDDDEDDGDGDDDEDDGDDDYDAIPQPILDRINGFQFSQN